MGIEMGERAIAAVVAERSDSCPLNPKRGSRPIGPPSYALLMPDGIDGQPSVHPDRSVPKEELW
jgi:hypothetical protein